MRSVSVFRLLGCAILCSAILTPDLAFAAVQASADSGPIAVAPVTPLFDVDAERKLAYLRRTAIVRLALETGLRAENRADSLLVLTQAVDTAQLLVLTDPDDPESQYLFAVAVGQRLELSGTSEKIRLGAITRSAAERALELDPEHAGAHHVLGRLNAATMRMGRAARFVARRLLGASALENVSWEAAEFHFAQALAIEPRNPRHSMELGMLLSDTGRREEAVSALRFSIAQPPQSFADSLAVQRATRVLERLQRGRRPD
jgi:tetratricopeptide (TPR) repeat protein